LESRKGRGSKNLKTLRTQSKTAEGAEKKGKTWPTAFVVSPVQRLRDRLSSHGVKCCFEDEYARRRGAKLELNIRIFGPGANPKNRRAQDLCRPLGRTGMGQKSKECPITGIM
jgi:hypothetical protein